MSLRRLTENFTMILNVVVLVIPQNGYTNDIYGRKPPQIMSES